MFSGNNQGMASGTALTEYNNCTCIATLKTGCFVLMIREL